MRKRMILILIFEETYIWNTSHVDISLVINSCENLREKLGIETVFLRAVKVLHVARACIQEGTCYAARADAPPPNMHKQGDLLQSWALLSSYIYSSRILVVTCSLLSTFINHTMSLPKHLSLPAPVTHSSHFSSSQSKSHVLAGLQDAYWSDDDAVSNPILSPVYDLLILS